MLLRPEIYVTAALAGAGAYTALVQLDLSYALSAGFGAFVAFVIRGGALKFGWRLTGYRQRPGRHPDEIPSMRR